MCKAHSSNPHSAIHAAHLFMGIADTARNFIMQNYYIKIINNSKIQTIYQQLTNKGSFNRRNRAFTGATFGHKNPCTNPIILTKIHKYTPAERTCGTIGDALSKATYRRTEPNIRRLMNRAFKSRPRLPVSEKHHPTVQYAYFQLSAHSQNRQTSIVDSPLFQNIFAFMRTTEDFR